jgi:FixJ family two-component response regulator
MAMIVRDGLQTKQIAAQLGLSEITVKLCRGALMKSWARPLRSIWA